MPASSRAVHVISDVATVMVPSPSPIASAALMNQVHQHLPQLRVVGDDRRQTLREIELEHRFLGHADAEERLRLAHDLVDVERLQREAAAPGVRQHLAAEIGGAARRQLDLLERIRRARAGSAARARSRLALPRMAVSRLLKSCAMPPASTPRLSSFCVSCIRRSTIRCWLSARRRAITPDRIVAGQAQQRNRIGRPVDRLIGAGGHAQDHEPAVGQAGRDDGKRSQTPGFEPPPRNGVRRKLCELADDHRLVCVQDVQQSAGGREIQLQQGGAVAARRRVDPPVSDAQDSLVVDFAQRRDGRPEKSAEPFKRLGEGRLERIGGAADEVAGDAGEQRLELPLAVLLGDVDADADHACHLAGDCDGRGDLVEHLQTIWLAELRACPADAAGERLGDLGPPHAGRLGREVVDALPDLRPHQATVVAFSWVIARGSSAPGPDAKRHGVDERLEPRIGLGPLFLLFHFLRDVANGAPLGDQHAGRVALNAAAHFEPSVGRVPIARAEAQQEEFAGQLAVDQRADTRPIVGVDRSRERDRAGQARGDRCPADRAPAATSRAYSPPRPTPTRRPRPHRARRPAARRGRATRR